MSTSFTPRNFHDFSLVNRQGSTVTTHGFSVEVSTEGTRLSYSHFQHLSQEPHYWQLPGLYKGDKVVFTSPSDSSVTSPGPTLLHTLFYLNSFSVSLSSCLPFYMLTLFLLALVEDFIPFL